MFLRVDTERVPFVGCADVIVLCRACTPDITNTASGSADPETHSVLPLRRREDWGSEGTSVAIATNANIDHLIRSVAPFFIAAVDFRPRVNRRPQLCASSHRGRDP